MRAFLLSGLGLGLALMLASCASDTEVTKTEADGRIPARLAAIEASAIPGYNQDNLSASRPALKASCDRLAKAPVDRGVGNGGSFGKIKDWQAACAQVINAPNFAQAFNQAFRAYKVEKIGGEKPDGLFTGYYEPTLQGSTTRHGKYQTPLHTRPTDLIMVDLGDFRDELKGQRIAGRVNSDGRLKPFESRAEILNKGIDPSKAQTLYYIDDPIEAFFLHIQGSGVVELDNGTVARVGYDGQNGHAYTPVGRVLSDKGEIDKDKVSLQTIRAWLEKHPDRAEDMMNNNKSYVFFKKLEQAGSLGGEGVVLTPERSLAVDYTYWPYGMPVFIDVASPVGEGRVQKLMVAQDTGGAIRGPIRGDVFWGPGDQARGTAGLMKSRGDMYVFLPRSVTPPDRIGVK